MRNIIMRCEVIVWRLNLFFANGKVISLKNIMRLINLFSFLKEKVKKMNLVRFELYIYVNISDVLEIVHFAWDDCLHFCLQILGKNHCHFLNFKNSNAGAPFCVTANHIYLPGWLLSPFSLSRTRHGPEKIHGPNTVECSSDQEEHFRSYKPPP